MKKTAVFTALALIMAAPVMAQPAGQGNVFDRVDRDSSGAISLTELEAAQAAMQERTGRAPQMDPSALLERLDTNGSGDIDGQEWQVMADRMRERGGEGGTRPSPGDMAERAFDRMDANGDGMLSRDEFKNGMAKLAERREERRSNN